MALSQEKWTRIDTQVKVESPRKTYKFALIFVSPGGLFIPTSETIDPRTQVTVSFAVEKRGVVAHAEIRRSLNAAAALERGIHTETGGLELRIVRMEGDGSQILAEHIKKLMLESGGPR